MGGKPTCCAAEGVASNHDDRSMASDDAEASSEELPVDNPMQGRHNTIDLDFGSPHSGSARQSRNPAASSQQADEKSTNLTTSTTGSASASCPSFATGTYPYVTRSAQRSLEPSWSVVTSHRSGTSGDTSTATAASAEEEQQPAHLLTALAEPDDASSMVPDGLTAMQPSSTEEGSAMPPVARANGPDVAALSTPSRSDDLQRWHPPPSAQPGSSLRSTSGVNDSSRSLLSSTSKAELERLHAELDSVTKYTPDAIACEEPKDPQWWGPYLEQVRAEEAARRQTVN